MSAFKRGRFDFHDNGVLSRLEPMVNVVGNALYASNGNVVSSGLKAVAQFVKCPLKNVEKSLPIFVRQFLEIIRTSGSTEADVAQTALKTLALIIRDCPGSQVKEKELVYLLELLGPDLEEPSRQGTAFSVLRAIVSRKFVVPEIYDLMTRVEEIMVTSQARAAQEQCRSVLLQFLLDYPQGKARLQRQFAFFAKNMTYEFESGRVSVMELLGAVISKFNDDVISEYAEMLFIALVLVVANDDSVKCREMAAQLVKALVGRLQEAQRTSVMSHIHSWAAEIDNAALSRVSSQMYGLILDTLKSDAKPYLAVLLKDLRAKIIGAASGLVEDQYVEVSDEENKQLDWQTPYQTLTAFSKAFTVFPEHISDSTSDNGFPWHTVPVLLLYPHAWVRTAACRLLGTFFASVPVAAPSDNPMDEADGQSSPTSTQGMRAIANALALQLKSEHLDEALGLQVVKNLFFVGKCFATVATAEVPVEETTEQAEQPGDIEEEESDEEDEEDENEKGSASENDESNKGDKNPLPWLFSKLSYQARSAHIARQNRKTRTVSALFSKARLSLMHCLVSQDAWFHQLSAIFRWFAAMASYFEPSQATRYLPHILSPVYRVSEDDITRDPHMDELKTLASELISLLQSRAGVTAFASAYSIIRQKVTATRHERRTKRALQMTADPVAATRRKRARNDVKREGRRRKMNDFA